MMPDLSWLIDADADTLFPAALVGTVLLIGLGVLVWALAVRLADLARWIRSRWHTRRGHSMFCPHCLARRRAATRARLAAARARRTIRPTPSWATPTQRTGETR